MRGSSSAEPPLALTCGDPSGIGPDIAMAAWLMRKERHVPPFYLLADPRIMESRARLLGVSVPFAVASQEQTRAIFEGALPILPLDASLVDRPGVPDGRNATGILEAIDRAVAHVQSGSASAVITNPIAKKTLYEAGFRFPGHTEYLAHLSEQSTGAPVHPVMMLAGPQLRAVPVTIHIALTEVPKQLTTDLIVSTARITARDLRQRFGIERPRLAVAGLNPHAGEDGAMGSEDEDVVRPAVATLREDGIDAFGPLPADTMFHPSAREKYDVAICMYHDQALIPAKALAFDETVNVTLGLPFVRTSPDHGTAFDIAGKGLARPDSLIAALNLASELASRQSCQAA